MKRRNRVAFARLMATTSIVALSLTVAPVVMDPDFGGAAVSYAKSCFVPGTRVLMADGSEKPIEQVRPGNHWNAPHEAAVKVLTRGLVKLGILKGKPSELIRSEAYRRFYMHRTGHWLGMDVHDVGDYKVGDEWRVLEPGMVLTVEPGLYIPAGSKGVARKWWNIGIRIEDDVLVTRKGPEVLTATAPKSVADIEALMAAAGAVV